MTWVDAHRWLLRLDAAVDRLNWQGTIRQASFCVHAILAAEMSRHCIRGRLQELLQTASREIPEDVKVVLDAMGCSRVAEVRMADVEAMPDDFRAEFRRVLEMAVAAKRRRREEDEAHKREEEDARVRRSGILAEKAAREAALLATVVQPLDDVKALDRVGTGLGWLAAVGALDAAIAAAESDPDYGAAYSVCSRAKAASAVARKKWTLNDSFAEATATATDAVSACSEGSDGMASADAEAVIAELSAFVEAHRADALECGLPAAVARANLVLDDLRAVRPFFFASFSASE
jgi:hypothetical protein